METQLDPALLITEARFNAVSAILVVNRLVLAAPDDLNEDQKKALRECETAKKRVETVREARAMNQPAKVRPYVGPFNASWTALSAVLAALTSLPSDLGGTKAERAQRLRSILFPEDGTPYLQLDAETAYVEAKSRLDRIARQELAEEIVALVGREHLEAVKKTTSALGEILGVGKTPRNMPSSTGMQEALKAVSRAVARYARKMLADLDEDDAKSVARIESAMAPLLEHKSTSRRTSGSDTEDPETPETGGTPSPNSPSITEPTT